MIAHKLGISRRTVFNWVKQFDWRRNRITKADIKNTLPTDMQRIATKMMERLGADLDARKPVNNQELYALANLAEQIYKLQKYELKNPPIIEEKPKGLTPAVIRQINRDILGWDPEKDGG